jgi:hypothetical protein
MLNPSIAKALKREIGRLNWHIERRHALVVHCRESIRKEPGDPVQDKEALEGLRDERDTWVKARTARVLQLMGIRVKGMIFSTWDGEHDPFLSSPSITLKCKKSTK